ncbi:MAG: hypothetical protein C75L2_00450004 [Leptospirillum sp. Group II 'C75']|uniref:DUF1640 domain-containing protein n=1 Tax=Leptospirillum sp. Group II '5-way CG' TaxID=419541 RepID=B6AS05_9BACT|nr:hypothetical protein [Leptospirillum sp. Group II 'CF-1']AKS23163.1 hypothetical protein ABH19_04460 [Leptospirillum sp. Group II 'CF-1']EAY57059.1 MAG: conserved hypothetical protein [Leptospirillum rubarum]EDZ38246.1 MAG: Conserved hypothetical protein [Leptospirillum sp. Group II '5-way CG']EIJ75608.1 MAG: hypothetical protein C75L2_00450004 [Leptospirillum sp. Group II 'C75']
METVLFDTHAYIKKLESSGVSPVQAEAHAEALLEAFRGGLATKADVKESENALRADMQKMETGIRDDMRKMETGIRTDMQKMESTLKGEFNSLLRWIIALVIGLFAAQSALFLKMVH